MSEFDNLLAVIRKDWESVPSVSKALAVFSILSAWFTLRAWKTSKSENIFILVVLILNLVGFVLLIVGRPAYLRYKYSTSRFMNHELEIIKDGGIWFIIDHSKKKIKWIANMPSAVDLGFRISKSYVLKENESIEEYLHMNKKESSQYRAAGHILITGRPGD